MGLVDYSDSESSDNEQVSESKKPTKGSFQKVVDRSNPGKIKVSLPTTAAPTNDEPPAKRAKTSGGTFGGFNSFLPAPKKTGAAAPETLGGGATGNGRGGGLGSGVSLKTGAAPAFSRDPKPVYDGGDNYDGREEAKGGDSSMGLPPPTLAQTPAAEVKLVGKPLMFKPLSVARKPQKKKKPVIIHKTAEEPASQGPSSTTSEAPKAPPPKVSLFAVPQNTDDDIAPERKGEYQPMLYGAKPEEEEEPEVVKNPYYEDQYNDAESHHTVPPLAARAAPASTTSNSLDSIASDLQLSASERRQLFGRQGARNLTGSKVINFNTDEEYRNNEELRSAGEQAVHNPVRSIAPGKHSLKQLLNATVSQKEALEESFAKGYANRKEASGRYGW
ncbi:hypothetical protein VC83_05831 [Pseudogymnoascus destructans]|uniref:Mitotic checkpoint regulator, MAD2B-interacting-domain-containing protein n=2 Tax=Pseudogymnoascus destructans TaxID=655981 RepID=L8G7S8_PSED2|nr:uncharacterized protein VC83_05831 [Pseudogymnoascus destructans]ELR08934.1 hypothetical protein GMDG_03601 [Pseudogymnoascus destructans 20631-21]OAF57204.1 hypothetical protein VC83_05831 [Pseudogymnoascus destructans]